MFRSAQQSTRHYTPQFQKEQTPPKPYTSVDPAASRRLAKNNSPVHPATKLSDATSATTRVVASWMLEDGTVVDYRRRRADPRAGSVAAVPFLPR